MNTNRLITTGVLALLLIAAGILTAVLTSPRGGDGSVSLGLGGLEAPQPESFEFDVRPIQLDTPIPLPGATLIPGVDRDGGTYFMEPLGALILLLGAIIAPTIGTGIVLYLLLGRVLAGATENTLTSDEYQEAAAALSQREQEFVKKYKKEQPPTAVPDHTRPGWFGISTVMSVAMFVAFLVVVAAANFVEEPNLFFWACNALSVTLAIGLVVYGRSDIRRLLISLAAPVVLGAIGFALPVLNESFPPSSGPGFLALGFAAAYFIADVKLQPSTEEEQKEPIEWSTVWIVFTGVVVVGVGLGIMMWTIGRGAEAAEEALRMMLSLL